MYEIRNLAFTAIWINYKIPSQIKEALYTAKQTCFISSYLFGKLEQNNTIYLFEMRYNFMFSFQDQITCTFIKLYAIYNIFMSSSTSIFQI